ncbi:MAG TPA: hypothetical protein VF858_12460, partial [Gemmatimonadaceae bacterium]
ARYYPEAFDVRIRLLRVTVPCVTGPYTPVPCKVTLSRHTIRITDDVSAGYERKDTADPRFYDCIGTIEQMYTSSGREDSGLHPGSETDGRLVWFEGAGFKDSEWEVSFPGLSQFPPMTIADVLFEMRLTFKAGGDNFRKAAIDHLTKPPIEGYRMFRARTEFPTEWYRFLNPQGTTSDHVLQLPITIDRFPFSAQGRDLTLKDVLVLVAWRQYQGVAQPVHFSVPPLVGELASTPPSGETADLLKSLALPVQVLGFDTKNTPVTGPADPPTTPPSLRIVATDLAAEYTTQVTVNGQKVTRLKADAVEDIAVLCHYTVAAVA